MKKRKKPLSMLLVIIFLFGIVTPQSVMAYEGETVSKQYYSGLTKEEQLKLTTEVKADGEFFQECEEKGYTIEESKGIFYLNDVFLFTIDEGGRFLYEDKDDTKIQSLSKLESIFTSETSIDKKEQVKELIQDEYNVDSIKDAYDIATVLKANLNDFINKDGVLNNDKELEKIAQKYSDLEVDLLKDLLKYKSFNLKGLMDWAEANDKNIFEVYMAMMEEIPSASSNPIGDVKLPTKDDVSSLSVLPKLQMDSETRAAFASFSSGNDGGSEGEKEFIPFAIDHNTKESISVGDGALTVGNQDYSLKGRNNLDLSITTSYNSSKSNIYESVTEKISSAERKYYLPYTNMVNNVKTAYAEFLGSFKDRKLAEAKAQEFKTKNPQYKFGSVYDSRIGGILTNFSENQLKDKTYIEKRNGLGSGWSWGFSSIETTQDKKKYLHLGSGETYKINYSSYSSSLENVPTKDKEFSNDNGNFSNGEVKSAYVLKYKTGVNEYFAEDGRLLGIVDRFGNTITFKHKIIDESDNTYVISEIIDTLNRKTTFTYNNKTDYSKVPGAREVIVTTPDEKAIRYVLEPLNNTPNEYVLKKKIDKGERVTTFNYEVKDSKFSLIDKKLYTDKVNKFALISSIEEPTGYTYEYTYEDAVGNDGDKGVKEYYKVKTRKDVSVDKDGKKTESNLIEYKYLGECTGYPNSSISSYKTQRINDKVVIESLFNELKLNTRTSYYDKSAYVEGSKDNSKALIKTEGISYDRYNLPSCKSTNYYDKTNKDNVKQINEYTNYDRYGNLYKFKDGNGNETDYIYTIQNYNNLSNPKISYKYSFLKEEIKDIDTTSGKQMRTIYETEKKDSIGNVIKKTVIHKEDGKAANIIYNYEHDKFGNLIKESMINKDRKLIERTYEYSVDYGSAYLTKVSQNTTDINNKVMTVTSMNKYDLSTGLVTETIIPVTNKDGKIENRSTIFSYDVLGRIKETANPDNSKVTVEYDDKNNISILTRENGLKIRKSYDGEGKLLKTEDNAKGQWTKLEEIYYDDYSRVIAKEDGLKNKTTTTYDPLGRVLKTTAPDSTVVEVSYDDYNMKKTITNYNTVTKEVGSTKEEVYDAVGNLVSETFLDGKDRITTTNVYNGIGKVKETTDANQNKKHFEYDDLGRLIKVRIPIDKDKSEITIFGNTGYENTTYEYDYLNNVIKTTTAGGSEIKKQYDEVGRLIKETSAEIKSELYLYNEAGLLVAKVDKAGVETRFTYDLRNRVLSETKGNITFKYSYDNKNNGKTVEKYEGKNLVETSYYKLNLDDTLEYSWTKDNSGDKKQISYEYNNNKVKTSMTDQLGKKTSYDYTSKNQLKTVKSQNGTTTKIEVEYGYTLDGKSLTTVYENGDNASYEYNALRLLTKLTNKNKQGNILSSYEYSYDRTGNKTFEKERILSSGALVDKTTTYSYDFANRVKNVVYPDGKKVEYSYDGNGNIQGTNTYKNDKLIENSINYYDKDNKLTKTETFGNIKELTITPSKNNIVGDEVITFKVSGKYNDGTVITQDDLKNINWTSGNPAFKLSSSVGETITGKFDLNYIKEKNIKESTGTLDVWAEKAGVRTKVSLQYKVNIVVKLIDSIVIEADKTSIIDGETITFKVTGKYKDGTAVTQDDLKNVNWTSSNPVFKLSSSIGETISGSLNPDYVKAKKLTGDKGTIDIFAEKDGVKTKLSIQYKIEMGIKVIDSIVIEADKTSIVDSEVATFKVTGKYKDGTTLSKEDLSRVVCTSNKPDAFIISKTTGESVTGKLSQEYFKKLFNSDFSGELIVTANLDSVSNDMVIKYKSNELENKNIILTISSNKNFLKDKESAILTVTGKYKDGKTVSDEVLSKVKWISYEYNIYLDKELGQQGKSITIVNCADDITPMMSVKARTKSSINNAIKDDIKLPKSIELFPGVGEKPIINAKIIAYLEDECVWREITIPCDTPKRRQEDPIWGRVTSISKNQSKPEINIKKENSNPIQKKIGDTSQKNLTTTISVALAVGEKMPMVNTEFRYDDNGNLIAKIVNSELIESYGYNEFNQLISYSNKTTGKNFTYDYYANGQRKSKCGDGQITSFLYDGENIIIELGNDGKLKNRYSIGRRYLSKEESNGNKYYFCYDRHGDVKLLTDGVGNVVKSYIYDIYGKEDSTNQNQGIENSIRYAGQYYDSESNLYYLRARYYSPDIMRFISEDTYKGKIENPLSLNYYSYCEDNPVVYIDRSGNTKELPDEAYLEDDCGGGDNGKDSLGPSSSSVNSRNTNSVPADGAGKVVPYTKSTMKLGQEMHKAYKADLADGITKFKEYILPSGKRIDFIDFETKTIYEFKPYNLRSMKAGAKQLEQYLQEVQNIFGDGWEIQLDTY